MGYANIALPDIVQASTATGSYNTQVLDAADDGVAHIFTVPKAGDISKIYFRANSVTGTPTLRASLQGVSSRGTPDGTILASTNAYADVVVSGTGWQTATLGTAATVAIGDKIAAVVRYNSGSTSATIAYAAGTIINRLSSYGANQNGGGAWTTLVGYGPFICVEYSTGEVLGFYVDVANSTHNTGSSPVILGNKWTPSYNCKISGILLCYKTVDTADFNVEVYEGNSGTPMYSVAIDASDMVASSSISGIIKIPIPQLLTLTAGTVYRFVVTPTTANNNAAFVYYTFQSAAAFAAIGGSSLWQKTTADTAGTWTDTANAWYPIVPMVQQIDGGAGTSGGNLLGGGLVHGSI